MARKTDGMTPQQLKAVPRGLESSFASWKYTDDEELFTIFKWLVVMCLTQMQIMIVIPLFEADNHRDCYECQF